MCKTKLVSSDIYQHKSLHCSSVFHGPTTHTHFGNSISLYFNVHFVVFASHYFCKLVLYLGCAVLFLQIKLKAIEYTCTYAVEFIA
jgi:hypothetical protein